jgi:hypothetical protein
MALQPFVGPWSLLQFRNLFYTVGRTPWTSQHPLQGRYLHTGQRIQNKRTDIHALYGIQTHERAKTVHALDRGQYDRLLMYYLDKLQALGG